MGAACWAMSNGLSRAFGDSFASRLANVSVSVVAGSCLFYLSASLLRIEELKVATGALVGRLIRKG
jgi:hypothetical protein